MSTRRRIRQGCLAIAVMTLVAGGSMVGTTARASGLNASTTHLKSIPANQTIGNAVTLQATVAGRPAPTDMVDFFEGTNLLGSGQVVSHIATLGYTFPAGTHALYAVYRGDAGLAASTSNTVSVFVGNPSPIIADVQYHSVPASPVSSWTATTPVRFVCQLIIKAGAVNYGARTGTVTFNVDGTLYDVTVAKSRAVLDIPGGIGVGPHAVTGQYHGDIHYNSDTSNTRHFTIVNP
jgi:hypothetical protein